MNTKAITVRFQRPHTARRPGRSAPRRRTVLFLLSLAAMLFWSHAVWAGDVAQIVDLRGKIDDACNGSYYGKMLEAGKGKTPCNVEKSTVHDKKP